MSTTMINKILDSLGGEERATVDDGDGVEGGLRALHQLLQPVLQAPPAAT